VPVPEASFIVVNFAGKYFQKGGLSASLGPRMNTLSFFLMLNFTFLKSGLPDMIFPDLPQRERHFRWQNRF